MSREDDARPASELELTKTRLSESLKTCRAIVADFRSKLIRTVRPANDDKAMFRLWDKPGPEG